LHRSAQAQLIELEKEMTERQRTEAALRESEDKFKYVFDNSIVGKSLTLPNGEINVNQAFCDLLGYTAEELQTRKWQELTHPDDVETTQKILDLIISGDKDSARFEKRYFHKNGSIVWADVSTSLRRDAEGKPSYFMTTVLAISKRKEAEAKLFNANRLYAVLSQINQAIIRAKDREQLFQDICNVAVQLGELRMAWIGLTDGENKKVRPAFQAGHVAGYLDRIAISIDDSPSGRGPTGTTVRENRLVICNDIRSDEKMGPWREEALRRGYLSSAAIPLRFQGNCIGALNLYSAEMDFFGTDISGLLEEITADIAYALDTLEKENQRLQAERNLQILSSRNQVMLEAIPDIIMEVDTNKIYTWANHAGIEFFGANVIGHEAAEYFEGEQQTYQTVKPIFNGQEDVVYLESWQRRRDGEKRLLAWWCRSGRGRRGCR